MANLNKVIFIGRLTSDPEARTFQSGGKQVKFGFVVNNRKKNSQTGQWEDEPMFIDCEAWNRGDYGKLADTIESYCKKGSEVCIEGRLHLDQWTDKNTQQRRSKHKIVLDALQLLGKKDGQGGGQPRAAGGSGKADQGGMYAGADEAPPADGGDEIPF